MKQIVGYVLAFVTLWVIAAAWVYAVENTWKSKHVPTLHGAVVRGGLWLLAMLGMVAWVFFVVWLVVP